MFDKDEKMSGAEATLGCVIAILSIPYALFAWTYVLQVSYYWFIPYVFPEAPQFTFYQFMALMIFKTVALHRNTIGIKDEYLKPVKERMVAELLSPWALLLFVWILKFFL